MPTLFVIGDSLQDILFRIEENDGELDAALEAWFANVQEDLQAKADGYCALITEFTARAAARKAEADRLAELSATDANTAKRLKNRLLAFMEMNSIPRIDTPRYRITVANNGGSQIVRLDVPAENLPAAFQRVSLSADIDGIRKALQDGQAVEGACLLPRGRHLRIS